MKIVNILAPAPYTVGDMKAEQVFKIGHNVYIRTQKVVTLDGWCEAFRVNNSVICGLPDFKTVTPLKAEFHIV